MESVTAVSVGCFVCFEPSLEWKTWGMTLAGVRSGARIPYLHTDLFIFAEQAKNKLLGNKAILFSYVLFYSVAV